MKYATTVVYVGTHFFPQFLENSRSHSNAYNNVISSEKHAPIKWERIDDSTENLSGITDGHQNYEKCECSDRYIKKNRKVKRLLKFAEVWNFYNLQL